MHIATVDTRSFNFTALGNTRAEAVDALMDGWKLHCRQYPEVDPEYLARDEISTFELGVGQCTRDYAVLTETIPYAPS